MVPDAGATDHGSVETFILIMVPFGSLALLAVAGAASAVTKAVDAEDTMRRTELWILFALLALIAGFSMVGAWWWWSSWQNFSD